MCYDAVVDRPTLVVDRSSVVVDSWGRLIAELGQSNCVSAGGF